MEQKHQLMLTVIVTSYNQKECLRECLDSILMQRTDDPYEIVVADDASDDGSVQMIREQYGDRVRILERKKNLGLCRNIYDAFMRADGKYIYYMQGDDYLPSDHIFDKMIRHLEEHEDIFSVSGWFEMYHVAEGTRKIVELPYEEYTFLDFLQGKKVLFYSGMMRNTFKQDKPQYLCRAGRNSEEVQMWYYTLTKSKKAIIRKPVYVYRYRPSGAVMSYNAKNGYLRMLEDYARGFRTVEKVAGKKYRFDVAKVTYYGGCIDYYIQNNGFRYVWNVVRILGIKDTTSFVWIKLLMKLNHRTMPRYLLREDRLIRSGDAKVLH